MAMDITGSLTGYLGFSFDKPGGNADEVASKIAEMMKPLRVCLGCLEECWKKKEQGGHVSTVAMQNSCDCYQPCPMAEEECLGDGCICAVQHTQRICSSCKDKGISCVSLLVCAISQDCCASLLSFSKKCTLRILEQNKAIFSHLEAISDGIHLLKSMRSGIFNYWVVVDGWLVGMRILLSRFNDVNEAIRELVQEAVSVDALGNKNKFSIETAVEIVTYLLQRNLLTNAERSLGRALICICLAPEPDRFWRENLKAAINKPMGIDYHAASGMVFFVDREQKSLRLLRVFHVPAYNTLFLQDERFSALGDLAVVKDIVYILDTGVNQVWVVDVKRALSGRKPQDKEDDSGDEMDGGGPCVRKGMSKVAAFSLCIIQQLKQRDGTTVEQEISLRCPVAVCVSKRSCRSYDLLVTTRSAESRGKTKGQLWELSFEEGSPLTAVATSLCPLEGAPSGVAALSDVKVAVTVGKSLYIWTYDERGQGHNGTLTCAVRSLGTTPCGLYRVPEGAKSDKTAINSLYVLDEDENSILEVWSLANDKWSSAIIAGGQKHREPDSTLMGTASLVALCKPTFGCFVFNSFVFSQSGAQCISMITDAYAYAEVLLPVLRTFAEGFQLMEPCLLANDDDGDENDNDDVDDDDTGDDDGGGGGDDDSQGDKDDDGDDLNPDGKDDDDDGDDVSDFSAYSVCDGDDDGDGMDVECDAAAANDHEEGRDMHHNATNLIQCVAKLHLVDLFFSGMTDEICRSSGSSESNVQGALGHFSRSVRTAVRSMLTAIPRLLTSLIAEVSK
jgi:hypothetical protein